MIKDLKVGEPFSNLPVAVISHTTKKTSTGSPYLVLELCDGITTIPGKIWSEHLDSISIQAAQVYRITGKVEAYQGSTHLTITQAQLVENQEISQYLIKTSTLVFDIETIGKSFDDLDETEQDYFDNNLEKNYSGTEEQRHDRTGLYPMFGSVLTIGMYDPHQQHGAVFAVGETDQKISVPNFNVRIFSTEKELLEAFWETANQYQRFVTYNGNGFDFPFLAFRSAVLRVKIPFEISGSQDRFIDLAYKFRVNNRQFKLEILCKALGISNPKEAGVSGMQVARLHREGKLEDIAQYVSRDVMSTSELYDLWRTCLAGKLVV